MEETEKKEIDLDIPAKLVNRIIAFVIALRNGGYAPDITRYEFDIKFYTGKRRAQTEQVINFKDTYESMKFG